MKHIILIGYRGTGKTSVGRKLAEKLKAPFYDTDQMITDRKGKTIKQWVEEKGWESFRQEEKAVIKGLSSLKPGVVALGGGAVMDPDNREVLKQKCLIVWLTADFHTIMERMKADPQNQDNRPALSAKDWETEIQEVLTQRSPVYRRLADLSIGTEGKTVEAIADEICNHIQQTQQTQ
jgi:shikimate kinase